MMHRLIASCAALLFACAAPVLAAGAVELRADPISHGGSITLGDLFDGAEGQAAKVVVSRAPVRGLQAVLDADQVQGIARRAGLDWSNGAGQHRIIVTSGGIGLPSPSRRRHAAQVLVYARNIMVGEILSAADLEWSDDAIAGADALGDPDLAIGKAARRALRDGAPAAWRDLDNPKVVHRNDAVDVAYESDGVRLVLEGRAMADAAVGEALEVMNTQSKKLIEAVASGPDQAVVGPSAERLRAATYAPSMRTASLR